MKKAPDIRVFSLSPEVYRESASNFLVEFGGVETPIGPGYMAKSGGRIVAINLTTDRARVAAMLASDWIGSKIREEKKAMELYAETVFAPAASRVDLLLKGTPFQFAVWKALVKIPKGKTVSYQDIALAIGQPKAVRAVANAVGANPVALVVPCHRVIRADGILGGYAAGPARKRQILASEGVKLT